MLLISDLRDGGNWERSKDLTLCGNPFYWADNNPNGYVYVGY